MSKLIDTLGDRGGHQSNSPSPIYFVEPLNKVRVLYLCARKSDSRT